MECNHFDPNFVRRKLANMVILHEYPINIVEHIGFREFSASLQPLFKMVCKNTLKRDILKIYDYERGKTFMELEKIPSRIAISTSMWTSSNKRRQFMLVKAHYIDDSWTLESWVMRYLFVLCAFFLLSYSIIFIPPLIIILIKLYSNYLICLY